jgi:hypothetical protein
MSTTVSEIERRETFIMGEAEKRTGIVGLPAALEAKVAAIDEALSAKRHSDAALVDARNAYDDALAVAEIVAARGVVTEGNKTYVVEGDERRPVTADEKRAWIARQAAKNDDVRHAASALRSAELAAAEARDRIVVAERAFSATKYALQASVALADLLGHAFTAGAR